MLSLFKKTWQATGVTVGKSALHGNGVFAGKAFRKSETIEVAPLILLTPFDKESLANTDLYGCYFLTGNKEFPAAVGLGFASLYNHSSTANAGYKILLKKKCIVVKACRDIATNEEITVNYNGRPDDASPVYFQTHNS